MQFIERDNTLVVKEETRQKIRFFNLDTLQEVHKESFILPSHTNYITGFAINEEETILVLAQHARAHVYDLVTRQLLYEFKMDHIVKGAGIKFIKDLLGVRTDYGCFSLYKI